MGTFYTGELPLECSPVFINETAQASRTGVQGQDNTVFADVEGDSDSTAFLVLTYTIMVPISLASTFL